MKYHWVYVQPPNEINQFARHILRTNAFILLYIALFIFKICTEVVLNSSVDIKNFTIYVKAYNGENGS